MKSFCPYCYESWETSLDIEEYICAKCEFWMNRIFNGTELHPERNYVIDGVAYWRHAEEYGRGPGVKLWVRRFNSERPEHIELWHNGTVPEHFRDLLPDNAEFWATCTKCDVLRPMRSENFRINHVAKDGTISYRRECRDCSRVEDKRGAMERKIMEAMGR